MNISLVTGATVNREFVYRIIAEASDALHTLVSGENGNIRCFLETATATNDSQRVPAAAILFLVYLSSYHACI